MSPSPEVVRCSDRARGTWVPGSVGGLLLVGGRPIREHHGDQSPTWGGRDGDLSPAPDADALDGLLKVRRGDRRASQVDDAYTGAHQVALDALGKAAGDGHVRMIALGDAAAVLLPYSPVCICSTGCVTGEGRAGDGWSAINEDAVTYTPRAGRVEHADDHGQAGTVRVWATAIERSGDSQTTVAPFGA